MSHKIAKRARLLLSIDPSQVTHKPMLVVSNRKVKTITNMAGEIVGSYETYTLSHAKGSFRQVYQALKKKLRV